jgi:myo-inositol-1-phosphate synthase
MKTIRIAIVGVGNCATSLLQGLEYYSHPANIRNGLLHASIGSYKPSDIKVAAAFDIDERKVGKSLEHACRAHPNCTAWFVDKLTDSDVKVSMGPVLDGVAPHMHSYPKDQTFLVSKQKPVNVASILRKNKVDILLNYLPVGSERATESYAQACLDSGVSLINCMPVFIASNPKWAARFSKKGIPIVGDDVKGQLGATILHRTLAKLFKMRGVGVERTYQLNVGGNTDFLNMLNQDRLRTKKISKTEAVQTALGERLPSDSIHIGPSDYVPWQKDRKVCFLRIEGRGFGNCPIEVELRLSVEDSPNSAGVTIDAIRCLKLARERNLRGPMLSISAWTMKHPPRPMDDEDARRHLEAFITGVASF